MLISINIWIWNRDQRQRTFFCVKPDLISFNFELTINVIGTAFKHKSSDQQNETRFIHSEFDTGGYSHYKYCLQFPLKHTAKCCRCASAESAISVQQKIRGTQFAQLLRQHLGAVCWASVCKANSIDGSEQLINITCVSCNPLFSNRKLVQPLFCVRIATNIQLLTEPWSILTENRVKNRAIFCCIWFLFFSKVAILLYWSFGQFWPIKINHDQF